MAIWLKSVAAGIASVFIALLLALAWLINKISRVPQVATVSPSTLGLVTVFNPVDPYPVDPFPVSSVFIRVNPWSSCRPQLRLQ